MSHVVSFDPFPVFLRLEGRSVLVVGGGAVASSKLAGLIDAGARVSVVAPVISDAIEQSGAAILRREFQSSDLDGAWFAVAAATPEVNRAVAAAAAERRIFVNAVDDRGAASAWLGGVLRKGGVTVAISTGSRAPALAGLLREALEAVLPDDLHDWAGLAQSLRLHQREAGIPMRERRPLLFQALSRLYANRSAA